MRLHDGSFRVRRRCIIVTARLPSTKARSGIALLLVLFTLLCAICPLGLPASQKLGPVFNPANEAVTVRPDGTLPAARAAAQAPDPRDPAPFVLMHTQPVAVAARTAAVILIGTAALATLQSALTPFSARGPPART